MHRFIELQIQGYMVARVDGLGHVVCMGLDAEGGVERGHSGVNGDVLACVENSSRGGQRSARIRRGYVGQPFDGATRALEVDGLIANAQVGGESPVRKADVVHVGCVPLSHQVREDEGMVVAGGVDTCVVGTAVHFRIDVDGVQLDPWDACGSHRAVEQHFQFYQLAHAILSSDCVRGDVDSCRRYCVDNDGICYQSASIIRGGKHQAHRFAISIDECAAL